MPAVRLSDWTLPQSFLLTLPPSKQRLFLSWKATQLESTFRFCLVSKMALSGVWSIRLKRGNLILQEDWVPITLLVSADNSLSGGKETIGLTRLGHSGGLASLIYLYIFYIYAQQGTLVRKVHCAYILNIITLVATFSLLIKHDWSTINMEIWNAFN